MYKILIVEDEVLVRVGLKTTIAWEDIGFTIAAEASNGEQGFELYKKHKPDVVITDIKMPKQDGLWLVENIRKENKDTKILVLTCYDEFSYARKALKVGADDYILKSEVEDEELIKLMGSIKSKLDLKNREKEVKEKPHTDIESLKQSLTIDLWKNKFQLEKKQRNALLDINFPIAATAYAFVGIALHQEIEKQNNTQQSYEAVINIFYEQMNHHKISYLEMKKDNYQFFITSENLNGVEIKRILTNVSNGAKQYFDISVQVVYSKVFEQIELADRVYKDFSNKVQILFYQLNNSSSILQVDVISFSEPNVFELKKKYNVSIMEAIGYENLERVLEILMELEHYFEQSKVAPRIVKIFYSNLVGDIFNNYGYFLTNQKIFETHETYHEKITSMERLSDIKCLVKYLSSKLIEEIKNSWYNNSKFMINQVFNFIEQHYAEDISLEDVAKEMNLSKNYLCSVFKKETGDTMSLYINKLRIEKAKQLLREPDSRIKEIYEKVGYSNQQYFSKIFKKITGMTIVEYKEGMVKK